MTPWVALFSISFLPLLTSSGAWAQPHPASLAKDDSISILKSFPASDPTPVVNGQLNITPTTKFFQAGHVFENENDLDASSPSCAITFEPFDISRHAHGKFQTPIQTYKILSSKILETGVTPVIEYRLAYVDHVLQIAVTETTMACKPSITVTAVTDPHISLESARSSFGENAEIYGQSRDKEPLEVVSSRYQCRYYFQINDLSLLKKGQRYRIRLNGSGVNFNATGFQNEPRFIFGEMPLETAGSDVFSNQINLSLDELGFLGSWKPVFRGRVDFNRKDDFRSPSFDFFKMEKGAALSLTPRSWEKVDSHDFMAYDSSLGSTNDRFEFKSEVYSGYLFRTCRLLP